MTRKTTYTITSSNSWTDPEEYSKMSALIEDLDFENCLDNGLEIEVYYADEAHPRNLSFDLKGESDYCCGCIEVGNLSPDTTRIKSMNLLFKALFEEFGNRTVIITTITEQKNWEAYLGETKLFKDVKSFKNSNSGNTVTIWVSTN